ncbi:hypothetical protein [Robertkochia sediminum]|uniref:hypothetical protein n=1 Tax=Robertkochia sediminum TaxID=2785326 RepID=UPI001F16F802|nr:hypothetical protein [Robertkochia sediminum]
MKNCFQNILWRNRSLDLTGLFLFFIFAGGITLRAQDARVVSSADTAQIRIGEQIQFRIEVETDTVNPVFFPEGQTFLPLEVVEAYPVDTLKTEDKYSLIKKYALTQFDSGSYVLPVQQIMVGDKAYFTDSLVVGVNTVMVDTTKQKMYDIKGLQPVKRSYSDWWKYLLLMLFIGGGVWFILYWFLWRKKPLTEDEKEAMLPPYDRALLALERLDNSRYLIQSAYKDYYSDLTNIVRSYLEDEVHITALESTTSELITKLEMLRDSGSLKLDDASILQFRKVLETADLVKFAKTVPADEVIKQDRKVAELLVNRTKEALPEPEENSEEAQAAIMALERKRKRRQVIYAVAGALAFLLAVGGVLGYFYGFKEVKDTLLLHPTKRLLEKEWVGSDYGYPSIYVETPEVLVRTDQPWPETMAKEIYGSQVFEEGALGDPFYINLRITTFKKESKIEGTQALDNAIKMLEDSGVQNMLVKEEKYTSVTGKEGLKIYGSMRVPQEKGEAKRMEYALYNFVHAGGLQQLLIVYEPGDTYAEQIMERILDAIDFKKSGANVG